MLSYMTGNSSCLLFYIQMQDAVYQMVDGKLELHVPLSTARECAAASVQDASVQQLSSSQSEVIIKHNH